jgi:hypothetical protein
MEGTGAFIHEESNVMSLLRYGKLYINRFPAEGLAFDDVNGGISQGLHPLLKGCKSNERESYNVRFFESC